VRYHIDTTHHHRLVRRSRYGQGNGNRARNVEDFHAFLRRGVLSLGRTAGNGRGNPVRGAAPTGTPLAAVADVDAAGSVVVNGAAGPGATAQ
jgi:hypothetical protein